MVAWMVTLILNHANPANHPQRSDQGVCKSQQTRWRTSLRPWQFIANQNESNTSTTYFNDTEMH
jgi:hypothetical protein